MLLSVELFVSVLLAFSAHLAIASRLPLPAWRLKRQNGESADDPVLSILAEQASRIPLDRYEDDPYLLQSIDKINSFTHYKTPYRLEEKDTDIVYERSHDDKDKDVIVLGRAEDKLNLQSHLGKQTYVVLRRNPNSIAPAYYVTYAYLR
jgi:hypothetical protein